MPNDDQPAKSYITTVLARADGATNADWSTDGIKVIAGARGIVCRAPTPQKGGVFDVSENLTFIAASRQDIPTLAKIALRAIEALEVVDDPISREALADINALAAKGSQ